MNLRSLVSLPVRAFGALTALTALTAVAAPVARLHAQPPAVTIDEPLRPVLYDFFVRVDGANWEASLVVFPDSAIVIPKLGACKALDRTLRRVSASRESWPCDGPSNVHDFQIIVDRQNHRATSWKATTERPFDRTTSICAATRTDENGKDICLQYEKITEYRTTPISGRIDLIPRAPARP